MKFLITASYSAEGAKGLMKEGGSGRKAAVEQALAAVGGKLEAIYYTFGEHDVILIADVPDTASALAISLATNATGTVRVTTTPLIPVTDVDAACKKTVKFRPAGS